MFSAKPSRLAKITTIWRKSERRNKKTLYKQEEKLHLYRVCKKITNMITVNFSQKANDMISEQDNQRCTVSAKPIEHTDFN